MQVGLDIMKGLYEDGEEYKEGAWKMGYVNLMTRKLVSWVGVMMVERDLVDDSGMTGALRLP